MAKGDTNWMGQFKPSQKAFKRWMRGQQGQFNPLINTLLNQYRLSKGPSAVTKSYEELIGSLPSQEKIGGAYQTAMQNLAGYMQNLDTTRSAGGVSEAISALGGAIGAEPGVAADIAGAAGTVSGVGAAGGDVMSKAILGGAQARLAGTAAEQMQSAAERAMQLRMGLAESKAADVQARRGLGLQLAQAKSQRAGAMLNPLELYSTFLGIRGQEEALKPSGGGYSGTIRRRGGGRGNNEKERERLRNQYAQQAASSSEWLRNAGSNIF